jgi:hypothetical protein
VRLSYPGVNRGGRRRSRILLWEKMERKHKVELNMAGYTVSRCVLAVAGQHHALSPEEPDSPSTLPANEQLYMVIDPRYSFASM